MTRTTLVAIAAILAVFQGTAWADDSTEGRILACASETDDAKRLSCYDGAAESLRPQVDEPPPAAPAATTKPESAPAPAPAPAPATAVAAAPVDAVAQFGMNPELASAQGNEKVELTEITVVAVEVYKRARGEHVVTLDNGQIWTEKDAESYFRVEVGDTVIIKRVSMGGYRMVGRGNRASAVRRIK